MGFPENNSHRTLSLFYYWMAGPLPAEARGFLRTRMTESPLRNILGMYRSLFTGFDFFLPVRKENKFNQMCRSHIAYE